MAQCLITKLKEKVDNDNLLKIDEIVIVVNKKATNAIDNGYKNNHVRVITPNVTFADGAREKDFLGYAHLDLATYPAKVAYSSKYDITKLNATGAAEFYPEDGSQLAYMDNLSHILTWSAPMELNLSVLKGKTKLTQINLFNNGLCSGDIANLASSVGALKLLRLEGTSVMGDLQSLIGLSGCTINVPSAVTYSQDTYNKLTSANCTISGGTLV